MWIRFLRFALRRPITLVAVIGLVLSGLIGVLASREVASSDKNPRQLIGRVWLDRYPGKPRDELQLMIFFGSGFGIYEHGSRFKASMEFFEFERQGDKVEVTFFQDKSRMKTHFTVRECSERHFDLCLDFESAPRGPKRYYSWSQDEEDEAQLDWAKEWKRAAEARIRDTQ